MTIANVLKSIGRYAVERPITWGGMAEIYLCRQDGPAGFTRRLIIKRIRPDLSNDREFVEMFLDEARLAAKLSHPNIVQLFDFGEENGTFFMVMERVAGADLGRVMTLAAKTGAPIPPAIVARIGVGAASGLAYAHRSVDDAGQPLNIVHRDISPSNIFVSSDGTTKILDFGIAKATISMHQTRTGVLKGKIQYMAPEHLLDEPLDGRADIYSLGVVLYQMLSGENPFDATSEFSLMKQIAAGGLKPLRERLPNLDQALEQIVDRCMARTRHLRYGDASALCDDLESYCKAQPQLATISTVAEYLRTISQTSGEPLDRLDLPSEHTAVVPTPPAPSVPLPAKAPKRRRAIVVAGLVAAVAWIAWALGPGRDPPPEPTAASVPVAPAPAAAPRLAGDPRSAPVPQPTAASALEVTTPETPRDALQPPTPTSVPTSIPVVPQRLRKRTDAEKPAPTTSDVVPAGTATLRFAVRPWGRIYIDGKEHGTTPIAPIEVSAGKHTVRIVHPDSGAVVDRTVNLGGGESQLIAVDLSHTAD